MSMVTWNMQGCTASAQSKWVDHVQQLVNNFDIVCLQEVGALPQGAVPQMVVPGWATPPPPVGLAYQYAIWNIGTQSRPNNVYIFWCLTDTGGNRVNLAICSKIAPTMLLYANPGLPAGRPSIGMQYPGPTNYFTLHALSRGGGDAGGLITNINAIVGTWFALGDYNRSPSSWAPLAGILCAPDGVTQQSGGTFDYMVKSAGPATTGIVQQGGVGSDHFFVSYD